MNAIDEMRVRIDEAVELARSARHCKRHDDVWCSCKVRWFVEELIDAGWTPPGTEDAK